MCCMVGINIHSFSVLSYLMQAYRGFAGACPSMHSAIPYYTLNRLAVYFKNTHTRMCAHTHTHAISLLHLTFMFLDCRRAYYVSLWVPMLCFPVFQVYKVSPVFHGQLLKDIFKGTLLSPLLLFSSIHILMFSPNWEAPNPHASI